jgi:hypothetical protein
MVSITSSKVSSLLTSRPKSSKKILGIRTYIRKWSTLVKNRAFGGGGGVGVRDIGSLSAGLSGGHTGLFV